MNHLRKYLYGPVPQKAQIKMFAEEATSVQGQILHLAPYRKVNLSLVLTKLSDEQTQRIRLCISQTFPN